MKPIFLVGFMGSGKSKLGKKLATKLKYEFLDSDLAIEEKNQLSIPEIFDLKGEAFFRNEELRFISDLDSHSPKIVAVGGGLPCYNNLIDLLNEKGTTVYLQMNPKELFARLQTKENREKRPLLKGKTDEELLSYIEDKLDERELVYKKADIVFLATKQKLSDLIQLILLHEKSS